MSNAYHFRDSKRVFISFFCSTYHVYLLIGILYLGLFSISNLNENMNIPPFMPPPLDLSTFMPTCSLPGWNVKFTFLSTILVACSQKKIAANKASEL